MALRLTLGALGRIWLAFVAGALLVTLVPIVIGWRPYVVQGDSMRPHIALGDIVLAAPTDVSPDLVGRVVTFDDPSRPGRVISHRVLSIDPDGSLRTRGDANISADSMPVPPSSVRGLGRLLVRFAGLPLIWAQTGQFAWLALFLLSLGLAGAWTARDREDDPPPDPSTHDEQDARSPVPPALDPMLQRASPVAAGPRQRWAKRIAALGVVSMVAGIPTTAAAFAATSRNTGNSWAAPNLSYTTEVNALGPYLYWKLDDAGATAVDTSGNGRTGTYTAGFTRGVTGALVTDTPNLAVTATGAATCVTSAAAVPSANAPPVTTVIAWFRTTTTNGGKIVGFEKPQTGVAAPTTGTYDRMIYLDGSGRAWFGVYNNGYFTLPSTAAGLNDNQWHMAAGVLGPSGMAFFVDGVLQASNTNTGGEATTGWWRAGCGNLGGWGGSWAGPNSPTTSTTPTQDRPFAGSIDEITVYASALTPAQLALLYYAR